MAYGCRRHVKWRHVNEVRRFKQPYPEGRLSRPRRGGGRRGRCGTCRCRRALCRRGRRPGLANRNDARARRPTPARAPDAASLLVEALGVGRLLRVPRIGRVQLHRALVRLERWLEQPLLHQRVALARVALGPRVAHAHALLRVDEGRLRVVVHEVRAAAVGEVAGARSETSGAAA